MSADKKRCGWALAAGATSPDYLRYHDEEWGVPVHDDRKHYEFLVLEAAQAGLSWAIVLRKRDNYRRAFAGFDARKVVGFGVRELNAMLKDPGLIRNRMKLSAAIHNAEPFLAVQKQFGSFDAYLWQFVGGKQVRNRWRLLKQIPAKTEISDRLSKDLKQRDFKFVGSTVMYAHMQAVGLVNDHLISCFRHRQVLR